MLSEATIARAHLFPECLPEARVVTVAASMEVSPPLLDVRRFAPKFLHLSNIHVEQNIAAELHLRADDLRYEINCAGLPNLTPGNFELIGTEYLRCNLFGLTGAGVSLRALFNLWVYEPTVAHKLKLKKPLTEKEESLADRLGLKASVEKGVLPLPLRYLIEREYHVVEEMTFSRVVNVTTTEATVETISPRPGEFLVLTALASAPASLAENVIIRIDRDDNGAYLDMPAYPFALDRPLSCFVPALRELRVSISASAPVANHVLTFTVRRVRLTNILRVRFGLVSQDEVPGDLWDKVKGGVL
ncbi:MAG: hypothetical protein ACUVRO_09885 [Armatimonadota bacterium]